MDPTRAPEDASPNAKRTISSARSIIQGAAVALLMGTVFLGFDFLWRRNIREISLTTFLFVSPVLGAISGWAARGSQTTTRWSRPASFFATEPVSEEARVARERRAGKSMWIGFGAGVAAGLAASAMDFAWRGWPYVSEMLFLGLLVFPYCGALLGFNLSLRAGDPKPSLQDVRFSLRTLMILTAYLAIWLGVMARVSRVSDAAKLYLVKSQNARTMEEVFQRVLDQNRADVGRKRNADDLRAGRIPDGILDSQKDFLKSLDQTATEDYKKYRYGLIADGEQRQADLAAGNVDEFTRIVDYHKQLAEKYGKAIEQPWLPVEPDPPMPGTVVPAAVAPPGPG